MFLLSSKSWLLLHNGQCGDCFLSFLSLPAAFPSYIVKKPLTLFLLAGLSFTVLNSERLPSENNRSLIRIASISIYIMKSSRSGFLQWCLLIFDTSLFHLSLRLPGSLEAIIHNISGEVKVSCLWLAAALLHFSKKLRNFPNSFEFPNLICGYFFTSFL